MFGFYRLALSFIVVLVHLKFIPIGWPARYAVFAFYVLSGFLMTAILNQTYGFTRMGLIRFGINRFLRLYPSYYLVCAVSAACIICFGTQNHLNASLQLPQNGWELLTTVTIIGRSGLFSSDIGMARLIPVVWSLSVEITCYVLLAVYFARSALRLWGLFVIGGMVTLFALFAHGSVTASFADRYTVIQAGFMPYACGGILFFKRGIAERIMARVPMACIFVMIALNLGLGFLGKFYSVGIGLYFSILLSCMVVMKLSILPRTALDDFMGKLAYPIFISHWIVASMTAKYVPQYAMPLAVAITLLFSYMVVIFIDDPMNRWRNDIKSSRAIRPTET